MLHYVHQLVAGSAAIGGGQLMNRESELRSKAVDCKRQNNKLKNAEMLNRA